MRRLALAVAAALALGACEPEPPPFRIVNGSRLTWNDATEAEIRGICADAATWWGYGPGALAGWTLYLTDEWIQCANLYASGCTRLSSHEIDVMVFPPGACLEWHAFRHEIGHVLIGDGGHTDPRWPAANWFDPDVCTSLPGDG